MPRVQYVVLAVTALSLWLLYYLLSDKECRQTKIWCPVPGESVVTSVCCSPVWLSLGAPLGLGNECSVDIDDLTDKCSIYSCYKNSTTGDWNVNGCSYVPDLLLNQAACDIHDLCYITPDVSKQDCDQKFVENTKLIYCDRVSPLEKVACYATADIAGAVVKSISSFYKDCQSTRDECYKLGLLNSKMFLSFMALVLVLVISVIAYKLLAVKTNTAVIVDESSLQAEQTDQGSDACKKED